MNKKRFLEVLEAAPELKKDKIAMLKKAITEGAYKVKAEDIAEKILTERLFELTLTLYNHKSKG
ncbi:MAG: flagellar biosynthesis anti-sigma factor FlgM [Thermodesulfobacteriota bacterium]